MRKQYEAAYLHEFQKVADVRTHLAAHFRFYNEERRHETLGDRTPHDVYLGTSVAPFRGEAIGTGELR
jgi:putative transposase